MHRSEDASRRPLAFVGSSDKDLRAFPEGARSRAGHQLDQVQQGLDPDDFKPMPTVGSGTYEIRVRDEGDQYRVFYVAKFASGVYVLHAFQKKTRKTPKKDIELARRRYREAEEEDAARRGGG